MKSYLFTIIEHMPYIVEIRSARNEVTITFSNTDPSRNFAIKFWVAGVFFPMAPSEDGERARRLTNTLFSAKDGGRHHHERASSSVTTLRISYDNIMVLRVNRPSTTL